MRTPRRLVAVLSSAAVLALAACSLTRTPDVNPAPLFDLAPPGVAVKVVTVEVICGRGRLVVDEATMEQIRRMPGVYAARRATGRNRVSVLVDDFVRPESIGERLEPECRGYVVGVETRPAE